MDDLPAGRIKPALTYFRVSTIIGPVCLTAVFGMGTGVSRQVKAPARRLKIRSLLPDHEDQVRKRMGVR